MADKIRNREWSMRRLHRFYLNDKWLSATGDRLHHRAAMVVLQDLNQKHDDKVTFTCPKWCKTVNGK